MSKKVHKRKRAYQASCKAKMREGLINNATGAWVGKSQVPNNAMVRDFFAGARP